MENLPRARVANFAALPLETKSIKNMAQMVVQSVVLLECNNKAYFRRLSDCRRHCRKLKAD